MSNSLDKIEGIRDHFFSKINFFEHENIEHDALVYLNDFNVFIQYEGCCSDQTLELNLVKLEKLITPNKLH